MKTVVIFAGGALTGAALCYLYLYKRYEKRIKEETTAISAAYEEMLSEKNERIKKADEELSRGVSSSEIVEKVKKTFAEGNDIPLEDTKVNYTGFSRDGVKFDPETFHDKSSIREPEPRDELLKTLHPMDSDEDEEVLSDDGKNYIHGYDVSCEHERNRGDKPKLIKYEEYGEDHSLTQATLLYYVDNDILTTEDDEEVDDPNLLVGNCLEKFGFKTNDDENSIFVRNYKLGFDYEIIKVFESYSPHESDI